MTESLQLAGAITILAAFTGAQAGRLDILGAAYLSFNFAGSLVLALVALQGQQWGFLLLESVWALVSAWSLGRRLLRQRSR